MRLVSCPSFDGRLSVILSMEARDESARAFGKHDSPSLLCKEQVSDSEDQCPGDAEEQGNVQRKKELDDGGGRSNEEGGADEKEGGAEALPDAEDGGETPQGPKEDEAEGGDGEGRERAGTPCFVSLEEDGPQSPVSAAHFLPSEPAGESFCPGALPFCPQQTQPPYPLKTPYGESAAPEAPPPLPLPPSELGPRPLKVAQKVVNVGELQPLQVKFPQVYTTRRYTRCSARTRSGYLPYPSLPAGQGGAALRLEGSSDPSLLPALPKKKTRTLYTTDQLEELERLFREDHYPDSDKRKEIAATIGVTPQRIMVWFQNRRAKWRKAEKTGAKQQERRQSVGSRGCNAPAQLNVPAPPDRHTVHPGQGPRLAPQPSQPLPHYNPILPSCPSPPGVSGGGGEQGTQPVASVGAGGASVEYVPLLMLSPPPLRRASLPLITSYLPANHLTPLLVDAGEGGSAAPHLDGAAREGQPFAQQSENAGSSGSLFDYGDVMGTAVKVDAQHYLHTGHQGGALSYQLSSYPQQHSSILPSSHLAQYSRFSYLPPSSGLTAAPSDGNPASYLTFGAAAAGGVMTYTAGGHTYFQSQSGNPILLQTGVQAYQPCPWGDVYGQPGQYPSAVYHRPQYPGLGRDVSLHPPGAALGLLPAQHCIPLQRAPGPPTATATVFATSQRPAVGAASAFQTPDSSALRPQYENPERAEQTESGEAEAAQDLAPAGGKLGYEPEAESARNPLPESRSAESDGAFDCDFSPIQF